MSKKYILRKRENKILTTEFILASILIAIVSVKQFKLHPAIGIIIAIVALFAIVYLFVEFRFFRYLFTIVFSLFWAGVGYLIGYFLDKSSIITSLVLSIVIFPFAIWLHWDHFDFMRKATVYEYERQ
jgi:hypothetical protein